MEASWEAFPEMQPFRFWWDPGAEGGPLVGQFRDHMAKDPFLTVAPLTAMEKVIQKLRLWHPDSCLGHLPHAPVLPGWRWAELGRAEGTGSRGSGQAVIPLRRWSSDQDWASSVASSVFSGAGRMW